MARETGIAITTTGRIAAAPDIGGGEGAELSALIAAARAAESSRDAAAALRWWQAVLAEDPAHNEARLGEAAAFWNLHNWERAEALYAVLSEEYKDNPAVAVNRAWVAHNRHDWAEAAARWAHVRELWPDETGGYFGGGAALRVLGQLEAAEQVYEAAFSRGIISGSLLDGYAMAAKLRGDVDTAIDRWRECRTRSPGHMPAYAQPAELLDLTGRSAEADEIYAAARVLPKTHHDAVLMGAARRAEARRDHETALRHWQQILLRDPEHFDARLGAATAFWKLRKWDEAEAAYAALVADYPGNAPAAIGRAWTAHSCVKWPVAARRWAHVREHWPDEIAGYYGGGAALRVLQQLDEAERVYEVAFSRGLMDGTLLDGYALAAKDRGDAEAALERWRECRERFPQFAPGYMGAFWQLELLDRSAEAEEIYTAALNAIPNEALDLKIQKALILSRLHKWPRALPLWAELKEAHPQHEGIRQHVKLILLRAHEDAGVSQNEGGTAIFSIPAILLNDDAPEVAGRHPYGELMMAFESLGAGCEFGLVQRHFGAEPLGFLRWGSIEPEALARGFDERFEGVGLAANSELFILTGEYFFRDKLYRMFMHTHVGIQDADPEKLFTQQCRRAQYLKNKLLDDLDSDPDQAKIFVYKRAEGSLRDSEIALVFSALRKFGKHKLLCMKLSDESNPSGSVRMVEEGLFIGYIESLSPTNNAQFILFSSWLSICRETYLLVNAKESALEPV